MSSGGGGKKQENFFTNPVESVSNFASNIAGDFSNGANSVLASIPKEVEAFGKRRIAGTNTLLKEAGYAMKTGDWNNFSDSMVRQDSQYLDILKATGNKDTTVTGSERAAKEAAGKDLLAQEYANIQEKQIMARRKTNILEAGAKVRASAPGRAQLLTNGSSKSSLLTIKE